MTIKMRVEGLRELDDALKSLSTRTAKTTAERAMRKALRPVADAAKAAAPRSDDGKHMADTITVAKVLKPSQRDGAERPTDFRRIMYVGAESPHAHLIEFGTVERFHKSGKSTGAMPAHPFMRPAWDGNVQAVLASLTEHLRREIDRAVARAARRAAKAGK
ncbi:HK97-gp10 family putative phage morphogenesis protein [Paragemmobacter ruber]|uniref:HK97 gp10 family phage protein n=1 Tax=Paragemmobacter ruber TaxID=1985673 RepID=A0ABW9Y1W7_9RHOB|nr:HK97-gp10 family putative phage morphogenesis protein [Rhodobacter ruber]NBE05932.1 hypothetical protein [Rhodobacter ruber]